MKIHQRKIISCLIACLMLLPIAPFVRSALAEDTYGIEAYQYMKYISENFPERIATNDVNRAARAWLIEEITSMGYEVTLEDFEGESPIGWGHYFGTNIIFTKKGDSTKEFVVGAHYDSAWAPAADDNGSGVGVLLETARRVKDTNLPYSVRFILFDAEEPGNIGSQAHVNNASEEYLSNIICMINLDTLGVGDKMMVYGGDYNKETDTFSNLWPYEQTMKLAKRLKITLETHPEVNANFPAPTKTTGSDNAPFNAAGVPYIYFEASNWLGGEYTNQFQVSKPGIEDGKIMHVSAYDNMAFIEKNFGDRVKTHLHDYAKLLHEILKGKLDLPEDVVERPEITTLEPTTEEPTTLEPTTEEPTTMEETTEEATTVTEEETEVSTEEATTLPEEETQAPSHKIEETKKPSEAPKPTNPAKPTENDGISGVTVGIIIAIVLVCIVLLFILILTMSFVNERRAEQRRSNRK